MIDEEGFRFGVASAAGRTDWDVTVPFSDIVDLEYKASGGLVSGALRDGGSLEFRIDQTLACDEAMTAVEDLFGPQTGSSRPSMGDATPAVGGSTTWSRSVEEALAGAARFGVEPQLSRFAQLTHDAGFDVDWFGDSGPLVARLPGTDQDVFAMYWYANCRCGASVYQTGAFGPDEYELMRALPKTPVLGSMEVMETDRFLDALEVFLASNPLPSRETAAIWQKKERTEGRGCGAAMLAGASLLWFGIVWVLLSLMPWDAPFGDLAGLIISTLLYAAVPVLAVVKGLTARRAIREYARERPDGADDGKVRTTWAWIAIILGAGFIVYIAAAFLDELSGL